ncbi:MAG: carboxypeptidase-like regulatory domain-containing protein [Bacteroidia bacterium]|jgi:hypothetical protein|nr:carboxypeptidase-like regulatory domain-containing protein [Bacteroidia bacterium]
MTSIRIHLPEPCTVPWQSMSDAGENRRHCASCHKVITDFSGMSDEELLRYFRKNGNLCGRFSPSQLDRVITLPRHEKRIWPKLLIPAFLTAASLQAQPAPKQMSKLPVVKETKPGSTVTAKNITITGKVMENDTTGLPGVIVTISGKSDTTMAMSDSEGNYSIALNANPGDTISLEFKFIGYERKNETLLIRQGENKYTVNIQMKPEFAQPAEISQPELPWVGGAVIYVEAVETPSRWKRFMYRIRHPFRFLRRR